MGIVVTVVEGSKRSQLLLLLCLKCFLFLLLLIFFQITICSSFSFLSRRGVMSCATVSVHTES